MKKSNEPATAGVRMRSKMSRAVSVTALVLCSMSATSAYAQEVAAEDEADAADVAAIIVTGSRLRSSFEQPTPVAIKTAEDLMAAQPAGIAFALVQAPQFSNSSGPRNNTITSPTQAQGNFLNLRGLGASRTLILVDGDRVPPTSFDGLVNVDIIPELLVSRVDVVTAGVSAVYGSDAVSGVVNYVLDHKFTGVKLLAQTGVSTYGDAFGYRLGGAFGKSFANDRGHFIFSAEHRDDEQIRQQDRPETARQFGFGGRGATSEANRIGTAEFPLELRENVNWRTLTPFPNFLRAPPGLPTFNNGFTFDAAGNRIPVDAGQYVSPVAQIGGSGGLVDPNRSVIPGTKSTRLFARASFDVANNVTAFVQGNYAHNRTPFQTAINFGAFLPLQGNPFLPADAKFPAAFGVPGFAPVGLALVFPSLADFGGPSTTETNESYSIKAGIEGKLGGSWDFRAVYQHGTVEQNVVSREINQQHLFAALDVVSVNGTPTCYINTVNPTALPGCVPYNPFGANRNGANLPALQSFLFGESIYDTTNKLDTFTANISGQPIDLPAGPLGVSFGVEHRRNSLTRTSNSDPAFPFDVFGPDNPAMPFANGIRFPTARTRFNVSNIGVISGQNTVTEANMELLAPITAADSAIGELTLSGAARWTDYSTSGTVYTWKAGATWEPVEQIRFRGTLSRDIRAPNLFELFAGATSGLLNFLPDRPFQQLNETRAVLGGGNVNLQPEVATTLSLGVILQPISGFNISVDYYDIDLKQAIQARSVQDIVGECASSNFASPACASITLDGGGSPTPALVNAAPNIDSIFTGPINLAFLRTRGIDIEANYTIPMSSGQLRLGATANVLLAFDSQSGSIAPLVRQAGYIDIQRSALLQNAIQPKFRSNISAAYKSNGGFGMFLQGRYIGKLNQGEVPGLTVGTQTFAYVDTEIDAVMYVDMNLSQTIEAGPLGSQLELFANVNNLFNKRPPAIPSEGNPTGNFPTFAQLYDIMGRYFTVGARIKF